MLGYMVSYIRWFPLLIISIAICSAMEFYPPLLLGAVLVHCVYVWIALNYEEGVTNRLELLTSADGLLLPIFAMLVTKVPIFFLKQLNEDWERLDISANELLLLYIVLLAIAYIHCAYFNRYRLPKIEKKRSTEGAGPEQH